MDTCCICTEPLGAPLYESSRPISITTISQVLEGHTRVWHCRRCGHTQTQPLPSLAKFYSDDYAILSENAEEDEVYTVVDGERIYRNAHQVGTLLGKFDIVEGARVLD